MAIPTGRAGGIRWSLHPGVDESRWMSLPKTRFVRIGSIPPKIGWLGPRKRFTRPSRLAFMLYSDMRKSISVKQKRSGRLPTGIKPLVALQPSAELRRAIEKWAAGQTDSPSLSEAIRRLVELGLASARPAKQRSKKAASKASELAARAIDHLVDQSAPAEEREKRKRRLMKGPEEFRDLRADLPKAKKGIPS